MNIRPVRLAALALLLAGALSGCASDRAMQSMMGSWVGAPVDEMIGQWGAPTRVIGAGTTQFLSWDETSILHPPSAPSATTDISRYDLGTASSSTSSDEVPTSCTRTARIDAQRTVVDVKWDGVTCPLGEAGHENWRRKGA